MSLKPGRNSDDEEEYRAKILKFADIDYYCKEKDEKEGQKDKKKNKTSSWDEAEPVFDYKSYQKVYQKKIKDKRGKLIFILIYLIFFILLFMAIPFFSYLRDDCLASKCDILRVMIYVSCMGGLGGSVYGLWGYSLHLYERDFNFKWEPWYYIRPFLGFVMGFVSYLLIGGGLMVLENSSTSECDNLLFYMAVAFLAGFFVKQFIDKLHNIAGSIFTINDSDVRNQH